MTPAKQGKHCEKCQIQVVDFTQMSDAELVSFLQSQNGTFCGRYRTDQLNRPLEVKQNHWSKFFFSVLGFLLYLIPGKAQVSAQQNGVEVTRISGPGTEPQFEQTADSADFHFNLKPGVVTSDPDLKFIVVEGLHFSLRFEADENGHFSIDVPNLWDDMVYHFSFYTAKGELLGKYPVPVKDAEKYKNSQMHIKTISEVQILSSKRIGYEEITTMGISVTSYYSEQDNWRSRTIRTGANPAGIYPVNTPETVSQGKMPLHLSYKVENGTHDLPGFDENLKLEQIK